MSDNNELLLTLAVGLALWLAPTFLVLRTLREEFRKTHARIDDLEARLRSRFESLEGEFGHLRLSKFGLFRVSRTSKQMQEMDWRWTVAEIVEAADKEA